MERRAAPIVALLVLGLVLPQALPDRTPLDPAFTYQGRLTDGGQPAGATYEMVFDLYGDANGTVWLDRYPDVGTVAVDVQDGLFTVAIDFDGVHFNGEKRWLEITVNATTLTPLQELTPAPFATYAAKNWALAGNAGTAPTGDFLGTSDNQPLLLKVNGERALRLEPANAPSWGFSPNVVGGFSGNEVSPGVVGATIGGGGYSGYLNRITDAGGTVSGGVGNQAGDAAGTTDDALFATVGGGAYNAASDSRATVSGGSSNTASGRWAAVGGGRSNTASEDDATIGGGDGNEASGSRATVGGGYHNTADSGGSTVGGGSGNEARNGGATIAGGSSNIAIGSCAFIGGGESNQASASHATIGGGRFNEASGEFATVAGGGWYNVASGERASIGGGAHNHVTSAYATVAGGCANNVYGAYATVAGGHLNIAQEDYTLAAGHRARANHTGAFVWADSTDADFESQRADQFRIRAGGGARFDDGAQWVDIRDDGVNLMTTSTGAVLTLGGVWANNSDRHRKRDLTPVSGRELLLRLASLPISSWCYRAESPSVRHIGPMAQDFHAAFGVGVDDKHIGTMDADGVALAAIQGLYAVVQERDEEIAGLRERLVDLETRLEALERSTAANAPTLKQED